MVREMKAERGSFYSPVEAVGAGLGMGSGMGDRAQTSEVAGEVEATGIAAATCAAVRAWAAPSGRRWHGRRVRWRG